MNVVLMKNYDDDALFMSEDEFNHDKKKECCFDTTTSLQIGVLYNTVLCSKP